MTFRASKATPRPVRRLPQALVRAVPASWNALPHLICPESTSPSFKQQLKQHLLWGKFPETSEICIQKLECLFPPVPFLGHNSPCGYVKSLSSFQVRLRTEHAGSMPAGGGATRGGDGCRLRRWEEAPGEGPLSRALAGWQGGDRLAPGTA